MRAGNPGWPTRTTTAGTSLSSTSRAGVRAPASRSRSSATTARPPSAASSSPGAREPRPVRVRDVTAPTRREFLAGAAGAGLTLAAPAWSRPRRAAGPRRRSDLERIEHVVILMQENRSFDHYYGTLPGARGFADPHAIKLPSGRSVFEQPYPATPEGYLRPWHFDATAASPCQVLVDNGWTPRHNAWANGDMDGFVGATANLPNYF